MKASCAPAASFEGVDVGSHASCRGCFRAPGGGTAAESETAEHSSLRASCPDALHNPENPTPPLPTATATHIYMYIILVRKALNPKP